MPRCAAATSRQKCPLWYRKLETFITVPAGKTVIEVSFFVSKC